MIRATLPDRGRDEWGAGHFGAARGDYSHEGHDFLCPAEAVIHAAVAGKVTKVGFVYGDGVGAWDAREPYQYVEIEDAAGYRARYFYVRPWVDEGEQIAVGDPVGTMQDLSRRMDGIPNHLHFEVRNQKGRVVDPLDYLNESRGEDGTQ